MHEKYLALARDAGSAGDRIAAENYLQHAEHYFRIINMDNDGDSQGRGRSQTNGGGRAERAFDGPDGQDPTIEVSGETSDGAAKTPAEPVAAKANGADAESSTSETGSGTADAAAPAPKRRISRGNGKGRRTRATPKAGDAGGDGAAAGTNGADGDTPLAEE